jgi:hypothetical protein
LESIFAKYGYHVLDHVLRLCIATWEGEANSFSANILNAIAKLIVVYGDNLNDDTFKEKLSALSIKQLIRNSKERRPGMLGVAEVMVLEYNGRKKSGSSHRLLLRNLGSIIFLVGLAMPHYRLLIPSASLDMNLRQCFRVITPTATNSGTACFLTPRRTQAS